MRMNRRRSALALAGAVLGSVLLAGCGSSTSVAEFCDAGDGFAKATEFEQGVRAAERLDDTGKPEGMPDDARDGFDVVVDLVAGAEDQEDLQQRYAELTAEERKSVDALDTYIEKTC